MIQPGTSQVGLVNGEELDDEKVIVYPACPAREAVVLQPNTGVSFLIVLDDVVRCTEAPCEPHVLHGASKRLRPWSLRAEVASLAIVTVPAT
jgi:hypothetical protein